MAAFSRILGRIEHTLKPKKGKLKTLDQATGRGRSETQVSQILSDVHEQIAEDGVRSITVFGDRAFHHSLTATVP